MIPTQSRAYGRELLYSHSYTEVLLAGIYAVRSASCLCPLRQAAFRFQVKQLAQVHRLKSVRIMQADVEGADVPGWAVPRALSPVLMLGKRMSCAYFRC
jgi:hypothetical protein